VLPVLPAALVIVPTETELNPDRDSGHVSTNWHGELILQYAKFILCKLRAPINHTCSYARIEQRAPHGRRGIAFPSWPRDHLVGNGVCRAFVDAADRRSTAESTPGGRYFSRLGVSTPWTDSIKIAGRHLSRRRASELISSGRGDESANRRCDHERVRACARVARYTVLPLMSRRRRCFPCRRVSIEIESVLPWHRADLLLCIGIMPCRMHRVDNTLYFRWRLEPTKAGVKCRRTSHAPLSKIGDFTVSGAGGACRRSSRRCRCYRLQLRCKWNFSFARSRGSRKRERERERERERDTSAVSRSSSSCPPSPIFFSISSFAEIKLLRSSQSRAYLVSVLSLSSDF